MSLDEAAEIKVGERYRRDDGLVVIVTEVIGGSVTFKLENPPFTPRHPYYCLRRKQFRQRMDGPI